MKVASCRLERGDLRELRPVREAEPKRIIALSIFMLAVAGAMILILELNSPFSGPKTELVAADVGSWHIAEV